MTKITHLCWQEIPSVIEAKDSSGTHKIELSLRFQELIDKAAMKRDLYGSDTYLMEWCKTKQPERDEPAEEAANIVAAEVEARYDEIKTAALAITKA